MKTMLGLIFVLMFSGYAHAGNSLLGRWEGSYLCGQGLTRFHMELNRQGRGYFAFYRHRTNPGVPSGEFEVSLRSLPGKAFAIVAGNWRERPDGYNTISLAGVISGDGRTISGTVIDRNCDWFAAERQ